MDSACVNQSKFVFVNSGANLPKDHIVFSIKSVVREFFDKYWFLFDDEKKKGNKKKYSNEELLGFYVLCYSMGITSVREMNRRLYDNVESFDYILNDKKPSKSTLSNFKNKYDWIISEFFYFTIEKGIELDLIDGDVAVGDGTIVKANASNDNRIAREKIPEVINLISKFKYRGKRDTTQKELNKYFRNNKNETTKVTEILNKFNKPTLNLIEKALKSKKERDGIIEFLNEITKYHDPNTKYDINLTDPESRYMKDKKGVSGQNYNVQAVSDSKNQMLLYVGVNIDANDYNQLIPLIESTIMSLQFTPNFFTVDNGYWTNNGLNYCYDNKINLIIPNKAEAQKRNNKKSKKKYPKNIFPYDRVNNCFICPEGPILHHAGIKKQNGKLYDRYTSEECKNCPHRKDCTKQSQREILETRDPVKKKFNDDFYSDKGQEIYNKRASSIESIFGVNKFSRNYSNLKRKGIKKCTIDLQLIAIAHNMKIIDKELNKKIS